MTSTVAPGEAGEREISRFIERRAQRSGRDEANALEEAWAASERRVLEKQREANRSAWFAYFSHLAHSCRQRAEEYEARAEQLLQEREV